MTFPLASVCGVRGQWCPLEPAAGSGNPVASWCWVHAQAHLEPGMLQGLFCIGSPVNRHHWVRTTQAQGLWPGEEGQESLAAHGAPRQSHAASLPLGTPMHRGPCPPLSTKLMLKGQGMGKGTLQHSQLVIDQHFDDKALGFPCEPLEHPLLKGHIVVADVHQRCLVILPHEGGDPCQAAKEETLSLGHGAMGNSMASTEN